MKKNTFIVLLLIWGFQVLGQNKQSISELLDLAYQNNFGLKAAALAVDQKKALIKGAFDMDKTSVYYSYDQNNLAINNVPIRVFGIAQDFKFPTVYGSEKKVKSAELEIEKTNYDILKEQLKEEVYAAYYELSFQKNRRTILEHLDSLYKNSTSFFEANYKLGEIDYLEYLKIKSERRKVIMQYQQAVQEVQMATQKLENLVQIKNLSTVDEPLERLFLKEKSLSNNISLKYAKKMESLYDNMTKKEANELLPDISLEYFQGTNNQLNSNLIGYQIGLKIPLFFGGKSSKIKASKIAKNSFLAKQEDLKIHLNQRHQELLSNLKQITNALDYYEEDGNALQSEIRKTARKKYEQGEINYLEFIENLKVASQIQLDYLTDLNAYNQTIIKINHLTLKSF
tara:strand:+ start:96925 stop:98118 length:1194 start_codon:yes stop_codon:yes gene_type:complete